MRSKVVIRNAEIINEGLTFNGDLAIEGSYISEVKKGSLSGTFDREIDATGLTLIPGMIDDQVHFREPGLTHKANIFSESRAALAGGITSFMEMPNTIPNTVTQKLLEEKFQIAKQCAFSNYSFFMGANNENLDEVLQTNPKEVCGVKVFMGLSTGTLLVSGDKELDRILSNINNRASFHSEDQDLLEERKKYRIKGDTNSHEIWRNDEQCFKATKRIVKIARKNKKNIHILHVSTGQEIEFLAKNKDIASVEITPQHLTLNAPDCYDNLGNYAQMNPPIRSLEHQEKLWEGIRNGTADIIGSDHAPHSRDEKEVEYPDSPSGMPGVQTLVPIMLNHVNNEKLTLQRFVELTSYNPSRLFKIRGKGQIAIGYDADFTVIDINRERVITNDWIASKCGWTPYNNMKVKGWPVMTIIRDNIVMKDDIVFDPLGEPMSFVR